MIAPPKPPSHDELEALIREARARQRRRRLLGAAGVAALAALVLGIYATIDSNRAIRTAARRPTAVIAAGCRMPSLAVRSFAMSNPTGLGRLGLRLTNEGSQPCMLAGYPLLEFYDRRGSIPFRYDRRDTLGSVLLRPGRAAYTVFAKFRCDIGVGRSATHGTIALSGHPQLTAGFRGGPAICKPGVPSEGRTVLVYPFEPTLRLAYATSLAQS